MKSNNNQPEEGNTTALLIYTLGGFRVERDGTEIKPTAWGREKALHLFQYLVTNRQQGQHKERIIDQLWPKLDPESGDRDFKVALNAANKALEPERPPRAPLRFIRRYGLAYGLNMGEVWIDADAFEGDIANGNKTLPYDRESAMDYYHSAVTRYRGDYLPERRYDDWTSSERERLQTIALGAMTTLADLALERNPLESIHLAQRVLSIDRFWEEAYRVQMRAYLASGNRPLALRTYSQCASVLLEELGIEPLPETIELHEHIRRLA